MQEGAIGYGVEGVGGFHGSESATMVLDGTLELSQQVISSSGWGSPWRSGRGKKWQGREPSARPPSTSEMGVPAETTSSKRFWGSGMWTVPLK